MEPEGGMRSLLEECVRKKCFVQGEETVKISKHSGGGRFGVSPGQHLKSRRIGMGHHVRLVDPGEALDRGAVESHALGERALELGRRHGDRLQKAQDVGEPHADEPYVPLLNGPKDELGLLIHAGQSAARVVTPRLRRGGVSLSPGGDHEQHREAARWWLQKASWDPRQIAR